MSDNSEKINNSGSIEENIENIEDLENNDLIDEEIENEVTGNFPEDPLLTQYATQDKSTEKDEKVDVTSKWIGEQEDWKAKSKLSAKQIIALIQVRMLSKGFSELEELEPLFQQMVEDMEKYAVSHNGLGREQHVDVLRSMHSGEMGERQRETNRLIEAFSAGMETEED